MSVLINTNPLHQGARDDMKTKSSNFYIVWETLICSLSGPSIIQRQATVSLCVSFIVYHANDGTQTVLPSCNGLQLRIGDPSPSCRQLQLSQRRRWSGLQLLVPYRQLPPQLQPVRVLASLGQAMFSLKLYVHEATFWAADVVPMGQIHFSACSAAWCNNPNPCNTHSWNNLDMQTVANMCRDSLHGDVSCQYKLSRERENMAASIWAPA